MYDEEEEAEPKTVRQRSNEGIISACALQLFFDIDHEVERQKRTKLKKSKIRKQNR